MWLVLDVILLFAILVVCCVGLAFIYGSNGEPPEAVFMFVTCGGFAVWLAIISNFKR